MSRVTITAEYIKNYNPFNTEVRQGVRNILSARTEHYSKRGRGTKSNFDTMDFLYGKTAYVKIKSAPNNLEKTPTDSDYSTILEPPTKGFTGAGGMYTSDYIPKPVVDEVRISNDGDYGSLFRANVNFRVFSLDQLNSVNSKLLQVGSWVKIEYGWTVTSDLSDDFIGIVYNHSFSLNADGSFTCTVAAVGPGFFGLVTKADTTSKDGTVKKTEDGVEVADTWVGDIEKQVETSKSNADKTIFKIPFINLANKTDGPIIQTYVTLGELCKRLQDQIVYHGNKRFDSFQIVCNSDISLSYLYDIFPPSSTPLNIIFPGPEHSKYETSLITDITFQISKGSPVVDLSKILISTSYIRTIMSELLPQNKFMYGGKHADKSLVTFMNAIFTGISNASGGLYKLAIIQCQPPVEEKNPSIRAQYLNSFVVLDTNYVDATITPYSIPVIYADGVSASGITRAVSLTSKLPSQMALAQYIKSASELSGTTVGNNQTIGAPEEPNPKPDPVKIKQNIENNRKSLLKNPESIELTEALQKLLEQYRTHGVPDGTKSNKNIPLPLELSITLDGIGGFRFGNNISINYLPDSWKKSQFTITKIEHLIQNNDWTTTLTTVHRST